MSFSENFKKKSIEVGRKTFKGVRDFSEKVNEKDRDLKATTGKGIVQTAGNRTGYYAGWMIGKPFEYLGQRLNNKFIMGLGEGFHKSTHFTGDMTGQMAQGTWKAVQGIIRKDGSEAFEGVGEIGKGVGRGVIAIGKTTLYTLQNSGKIISGIYHKDYEQLKMGASGVAKVVIIGGTAFAIVDLVDGDDIAIADDGAFLHTHNSHLTGDIHPITGVSFDTQTIELADGTEVIGVFPDFDAAATVNLPEELYLSSDYVHFTYANMELAEIVSQNPEMASQFSLDQLEQIYAGETPDGYSWHHHEQLGKVELVDEEIHAKTGHSGGRSIWGGGSDVR
ncbi:MAG: HNH endonuclease [Bacillus sp. (in: Bacteria)]|nr:HNH endonuclease [Bacillus sp. (in: firmicutes)]